jgi:hypothetical protein
MCKKFTNSQIRKTLKCTRLPESIPKIQTLFGQLCVSCIEGSVHLHLIMMCSIALKVLMRTCFLVFNHTVCWSQNLRHQLSAARMFSVHNLLVSTREETEIEISEIQCCKHVHCFSNMLGLCSTEHYTTTRTLQTGEANTGQHNYQMSDSPS